jgi:hypothetical protein
VRYFVHRRRSELSSCVQYCHYATWANANTNSATYFLIDLNYYFTIVVSFQAKDCNVSDGKCRSINKE